MVSCKEVLARLSDLIDNDIDGSLAALIRNHLKLCHRCSILHDTLRKVVIIAADERTFELPAGYSERLHGFIDQYL